MWTEVHKSSSKYTVPGRTKNRTAPISFHVAQNSSVPQENLEKELYKAAVCCISLASSSSYISELNIVPMTGVHARLYPPTQTRINLELVARQNKM